MLILFFPDYYNHSMLLIIKKFDVYAPFDDLGNEFLSPNVFSISTSNHTIVIVFNYDFPTIDFFLIIELRLMRELDNFNKGE
jgi:hypothetical protein